jgi:IstB-like ATP binding protein
MRPWRAGCGGTRTSGSEGGGGETNPRKRDTAPRRRPLHLPLERQAANLLFVLVARRYERGSIIVTSNRGFEAWGEILGDAMVAAALIDRLIHHAHIVTLKRGFQIEKCPSIRDGSLIAAKSNRLERAVGRPAPFVGRTEL